MWGCENKVNKCRQKKHHQVARTNGEVQINIIFELSECLLVGIRMSTSCTTRGCVSYKNGYIAEYDTQVFICIQSNLFERHSRPLHFRNRDKNSTKNDKHIRICFTASTSIWCNYWCSSEQYRELLPIYSQRIFNALRSICWKWSSLNFSMCFCEEVIQGFSHPPHKIFQPRIFNAIMPNNSGAVIPWQTVYCGIILQKGSPNSNINGKLPFSRS